MSLINWLTRPAKPPLTPEQEVDRVRNAIAFALIASFIGALIDFTIMPIPSGNKDIITYMVGQLSGMALMVLGYYFASKVGQAQIDAKRAENTGKLADAVVAAAAGTPPATRLATEAAREVANAADDKANEIEGDPK